MSIEQGIPKRSNSQCLGGNSVPRRARELVLRHRALGAAVARVVRVGHALAPRGLRAHVLCARGFGLLQRQGAPAQQDWVH